METIKEVFDDECKHLRIDFVLARKLSQYSLNFVQKNSDHINFFGGNLLGVDVVRFTEADRNRWFDEILMTNDGPLEERLRATTEVQPEYRIVASDTMNLSCIWLTHAILNSPHLSDKQKHDAAMDCLLIFHYKLITSILFFFIKYPVHKEVAEATYAQLNFKFSLKVYGTWLGLLKARCEDILSEGSIHKRTINKMDDDYGVIIAINDIQGRIKDVIKNIYGVFVRVNEQGIRVTTTSQVVAHDGVEILKDKTKNLQAYVRYINTVITDKNSFIRDELVTVIVKLVHTVPPRLFHETLEWMSNNYRQAKASEIEDILNETMIHSFEFLSNNKAIIKNANDLPGLLVKIKGIIMSSRTTDAHIFSMREKAETIVRNATGITNPSTISSVRTAILLYVILRTFTMRHYSNA